MNKLLTLLFCLGIFTCTLSHGTAQNAGWPINSEDAEEFNLAEEGAIDEDGGFTDGIFVNLDDNQIIEWEEGLGNTPISEEEGESEEFTEGILVSGDDNQIFEWEDEAGDAPISEEEGEFEEFTEGILINGDDNQIFEWENESSRNVDRIDEEIEFGEWQGETENIEFLINSTNRNFLV